MKIYIKTGSSLNEKELEQIWDILCECDYDFDPPLSARESSFQQGLAGISGSTQSVKPVKYFDAMKTQEFIILEDEQEMQAFMTFRPGYSCESLEPIKESLYVTTVCVRKTLRGKGLCTKLYEYLEQYAPAEYGCNILSTRTWSTNASQMHTLPKRKWLEYARIEHDRPSGADTVYFVKEIQ